MGILSLKKWTEEECNVFYNYLVKLLNKAKYKFIFTVPLVFTGR